MFLRKLGKRGAEMVEYAIVLACIAAVGVGFYSSNDSKLTGVLDSLFGNVRQVLGLADSGNLRTQTNRALLKEGDYPDELKYAINAIVDGIHEDFANQDINLRSFKIDKDGNMTKATYWNDNGTYSDLSSDRFTQANYNSILEGTGFTFAKDGTGTDTTAVYFNQQGQLLMPSGNNEKNDLTDGIYPRVVIKNDSGQYRIEGWVQGNVVSKDNENSFLNVNLRQ